MEEDQKLFDMCTQNFLKQQESESNTDDERQKKWEIVEKKAKSNPQTMDIS
jgi:hypothetical protein